MTPPHYTESSGFYWCVQSENAQHTAASVGLPQNTSYTAFCPELLVRMLSCIFYDAQGGLEKVVMQ
jgi:hypothetical protein